MTITEFLLARIAEDEAVARAMPFDPEWTAHPDETGQPIKAGNARIATCAESVMAHIARHDPARVLAECEAKRRIVELHVNMNAAYSPEIAVCAVCHDRLSHDAARWPCDTLRALASVYADHPDFDPAWQVAAE